MNANDNTVPFPVRPTSNDGEDPPPRTKLQRLATRWHTLNSPDSWLRTRLTEIRHAPKAGWRHMATWIKVLLTLPALAATTALGWWSISALITWQPWTELGDNGLLATITRPVHGYLASHTGDLPLDAHTAYRTWQVIGGAAFLTSAIFRATGARLTWTAWGAATTAMVWINASPVGGRAVATGLAALMWALASIVALRGLSLRPVVHNHPPEFRPELHLHATIPAPAAPADADFDDEPENVHPLQR